MNTQQSNSDCQRSLMLTISRFSLIVDSQMPMDIVYCWLKPHLTWGLFFPNAAPLISGGMPASCFEKHVFWALLLYSWQCQHLLWKWQIRCWHEIDLMLKQILSNTGPVTCFRKYFISKYWVKYCVSKYCVVVMMFRPQSGRLGLKSACWEFFFFYGNFQNGSCWQWLVVGRMQNFFSANICELIPVEAISCALHCIALHCCEAHIWQCSAIKYAESHPSDCSSSSADQASASSLFLYILFSPQVLQLSAGKCRRAGRGPHRGASQQVSQTPGLPPPVWSCFFLKCIFENVFFASVGNSWCPSFLLLVLRDIFLFILILNKIPDPWASNQRCGDCWQKIDHRPLIASVTAAGGRVTTLAPTFPGWLTTLSAIMTPTSCQA